MMPPLNLSNQQSASSSAGFHKNGESNFDFGHGDWNVNFGQGTQTNTALPSLPTNKNTWMFLLLAVGVVAWLKYR